MPSRRSGRRCGASRNPSTTPGTTSRRCREPVSGTPDSGPRAGAHDVANGDRWAEALSRSPTGPRGMLVAGSACGTVSRWRRPEAGALGVRGACRRDHTARGAGRCRRPRAGRQRGRRPRRARCGGAVPRRRSWRSPRRAGSSPSGRRPRPAGGCWRPAGVRPVAAIAHRGCATSPEALALVVSLVSALVDGVGCGDGPGSSSRRSAPSSAERLQPEQPVLVEAPQERPVGTSPSIGGACRGHSGHLQGGRSRCPPCSRLLRAPPGDPLVRGLLKRDGAASSHPSAHRARVEPARPPPLPAPALPVPHLVPAHEVTKLCHTTMLPRHEEHRVVLGRCRPSGCGHHEPAASAATGPAQRPHPRRRAAGAA